MNPNLYTNEYNISNYFYLFEHEIIHRWKMPVISLISKEGNLGLFKESISLFQDFMIFCNGLVDEKYVEEILNLYDFTYEYNQNMHAIIAAFHDFLENKYDIKIERYCNTSPILKGISSEWSFSYIKNLFLSLFENIDKKCFENNHLEKIELYKLAIEEYCKFCKDNFNWKTIELEDTIFIKNSNTHKLYLKIDTTNEIWPPELFECRVKYLIDYFNEYNTETKLEKILKIMKLETEAIEKESPKKLSKCMKNLFDYVYNGNEGNDILLKKMDILSDLYPKIEEYNKFKSILNEISDKNKILDEKIDFEVFDGGNIDF